MWTCSYLSGTGEPAFHRFELAPPDLIWGDQHFRILRNDEDGLVGTFSVSEQNQLNQKDPSDVAVAAFAVAINKRTGHFSMVTAIAGRHSPPMVPELHGKCVNN